MSDERFTLDTNILVYSMDARDSRKQALALEIIRASVVRDCPLALQAIGEFHAAAVAKLKLHPADARERSMQLLDSFGTFAHSATAVRAALGEAGKGRFSFWDAVLLASAAEAGCSVILSGTCTTVRVRFDCSLQSLREDRPFPVRTRHPRLRRTHRTERECKLSR